MRRPHLRAAALLSLFTTLSAASPWPGLGAEVERGLEGAQVQERRAAARRIAELSPTSAKIALEKAISDRDAEVRLIGLRTARAMHLPEIGALAIENLKSTDARERIEAVRLIALDPEEEGVAALEAAVSDADRLVRREAAEGLGSLSTKYASRAAAKLLSMLDDIDADVRIEVAASLGRLAAPSATLALAARLKDQDPAVRAQVALALGAIGEKSAVPALQVALLDVDDSVVAAVVRALGAMGSENAIVGLVSIAEEVPRRQQGEEALEALVRLSHFPLARERLLDMLESPEHRLVLRGIFARQSLGAQRVLDDCIDKYSSEIALYCARAYRSADRDPSLILKAQDEGRLSSKHALEVLSGVSDRAAIILALEQLSLGDALEFESALGYLTSLSQIPLEAEGPLVEALRAPGRSLEELQTLLLLLGELKKSGSSRNAILPYLQATDDEIKTAAATALTRLGAKGRELEGYLLGEKAVATGALEGLSRGMSSQQAQVLIRLVNRGRSGRRAALLSVFFAMPDGLPKASVAALVDLYREALGADRDALLYPLLRSGNTRVHGEVLESATRPDRLKIAQLAWYQPEARSVLLELTSDGDAHVAALAARSLGRIGNAKDARVLIQLADSDGAYLLRAAALQGLYFLVERGKVSSLPPSLFLPETCASRHDLLRAETIRLAASLDLECAGRDIEDVLRRDPDPRMRYLAASLLAAKRPDSSALRACRFYEARLEVARECETRRFHEMDESASPLPFRVEQVWALGEPLRLTPYAVRVSSEMLGDVQAADFTLNLFSDRSGHVVVPSEQLYPVDPHWSF